MYRYRILEYCLFCHLNTQRFGKQIPITTITGTEHSVQCTYNRESVPYQCKIWVSAFCRKKTAQIYLCHLKKQRSRKQIQSTVQQLLYILGTFRICNICMCLSFLQLIQCYNLSSKLKIYSIFSIKKQTFLMCLIFNTLYGTQLKKRKLDYLYTGTGMYLINCSGTGTRYQKNVDGLEFGVGSW